MPKGLRSFDASDADTEIMNRWFSENSGLREFFEEGVEEYRAILGRIAEPDERLVVRLLHDSLLRPSGVAATSTTGSPPTCSSSPRTRTRGGCSAPTCSRKIDER